MSPVLLIAFVVLAVLGHGYLWVDIVNRIHAWAGPRQLVDGVTQLCLAAFVVFPIAVLASWNALDLPNFSFARAQFRLLHYYLLICAFWGAAKLLIGWWFAYASNPPKTLLSWQQEKLPLVSPADGDLIGTYPKLLGMVPGNQVFQLSIDRKRLAIPQLNPKLEGLRIVHISDLHLTGQVGPRWYQHVAEQVNQLQADVIAITGDIVEKQDCWPWLADSLGKLQARYGVYFILGNHDQFVDASHTRKLLTDLGLHYVSAGCLETEWNEAPVILAGNELPWGPAVAAVAAKSTADDAAPFRLLLMHSPDQFQWACQQQVDLALAGHTHGGQVRFPILGAVACPSRHGTRYACGVFRNGNTVLHVTRGISGEMPLRWNCPPESAQLELVGC
ncbi:MAG: metallophosphoesterase [Bythopirellula sp.]